MKILFVGGTGTIGKHVVAKLQQKHEVITAGSKSGNFQFDMTQASSIEQLFKNVGPIDAIVVTAGEGYIGPLSEIKEEHFFRGIRSKMMGQINIATIGQHSLRAGGSITLTSGILSDDPIDKGTVLSTINSAVNGFVIGAAVELFQKGIRINVVSPGLVEDSYEQLGKFFPGHNPVSMERVANAYLKSIEGVITGEIIKVY